MIRHLNPSRRLDSDGLQGACRKIKVRNSLLAAWKPGTSPVLSEKRKRRKNNNWLLALLKPRPRHYDGDKTGRDRHSELLLCT